MHPQPQRHPDYSGYVPPHHAEYYHQQTLRPTAEPMLNQSQATFFQKVYGWMTMGLGLTAVIAWMISQSTMIHTVMQHYVLLLVIELALVFYLSFRLERMRPVTAIVSFLVYSALNGATLSALFMVYNLGQVVGAFLTTAITFGFMAILGLVLKHDLSRYSSIFLMALVGLIVGSIVNIFSMQLGWFPAEANMLMYWGITYAGILIFCLLTAWDNQWLKQISTRGFEDADNETRFAIFGALKLYLNFLNLFLYMLRLKD